MPDPLDCIREAKDETEALRLALQEIRDIVWEPKTTFPTVEAPGDQGARDGEGTRG
jgi:hypothetical protein